MSLFNFSLPHSVCLCFVFIYVGVCFCVHVRIFTQLNYNYLCELKENLTKIFLSKVHIVIIVIIFTLVCLFYYSFCLCLALKYYVKKNKMIIWKICKYIFCRRKCSNAIYICIWICVCIYAVTGYCICVYVLLTLNSEFYCPNIKIYVY